MKIGLLDADGHNFPNLALMKLSAYHKAKGDKVEWWSGFSHYDRLYIAKVFTLEYSPEVLEPCNADEIIRGGTGYDLKNKLNAEAERVCPDYSLYRQYDGMAYGFLTRGCPRNCGFCIVAEKEGRCSRQVADLDGFHRGQREIKLLDPNLLACPDHERLLAQLAESRAWVDFTQGLDVRLITPDNVALLNRIRTKAIHFAWDNPNDDLTAYFERFVRLTSIKSDRKRRVYVLCNFGSTHEQDLYRINTLRGLGYDPYVMIYNKSTAPPTTRKLQRWVNNKRIFFTVPHFEDYDPRAG